MNDIRASVRYRYGSVAQKGSRCCGQEGATSGSCCGDAEQVGIANGYSAAELSAVPEGANLGLGCGNPTAIGSLQSGETVLDLGSGAGFDCFIAARKVGAAGRVIGLDMTAQMIERARANAQRGGFDNVEFVQGYIEQIPLPDASVDVVISNCVINLSVDKPQVFREVARVLRPSGRMYVSDLVLTRPLPRLLQRSAALYSACVAGAMTRDDYLEAIRAAGLRQVEIISERSYSVDLPNSDPVMSRLVRLSRIVPWLRKRLETVVSLSVRASAPR